MAVQNVGTTATTAAGAGLGGQKAGSSDPVQDFMQFMRETPEQRMEDLWLRAHGLTRQQLATMSPAERQKILDAMKQDIDRQVKQAAENKFYKTLDVPTV